MKRNRLSLVAALVAVAAGCGTSSSYRESGPSRSSRGVLVSVAGVGRYVNRSADPFLQGVTPDILGLDVELLVRNDSSQVAVFSEGRIRLLDPAASAIPLAPDKPAVVSVLPGETKGLDLRFTTSDVLSYRNKLELVLDNSVELGASAIALNPITLVASR